MMMEVKEEIEKIAAQQVALEQQKEQEKIDYFNRKYKIKNRMNKAKALLKQKLPNEEWEVLAYE